jgi:hypothetical protein
LEAFDWLCFVGKHGCYTHVCWNIDQILVCLMQIPIFSFQALSIPNVVWLFVGALSCNAFQFLIV